MMFKCGYAGCSCEFKTAQGVAYHEQFYHGVGCATPTMKIESQLQSNVGMDTIDVPLSEQLDYTQDVITVEESLECVRHAMGPL